MMNMVDANVTLFSFTFFNVSGFCNLVVTTCPLSGAIYVVTFPYKGCVVILITTY